MAEIITPQKKSFTQIYFPKERADLLLPSAINKILDDTISKKNYRLLLHSGPGTGKSTTSRVLTKRDEVKLLSGSNDFNVETVRSKLMPFLAAHTTGGKQKTVIIEECENIQNKVQDMFKIILDTAQANFIFLTNECNKVIEPIQSRCKCIEYDFVGENLNEQINNYLLFIKRVCKEQKIIEGKTTQENIAAMQMLYQKHFPDFRHVLNSLEMIADSGKGLSVETVMVFSETSQQDLELYSIIEENCDAKTLYTSVSRYKGRERDALKSLGSPYFEYLNAKEMHDTTLRVASIVSEHSHILQETTINKFPILLSCVQNLKTLFR